MYVCSRNMSVKVWGCHCRPPEVQHESFQEPTPTQLIFRNTAYHLVGIDEEGMLHIVLDLKLFTAFKSQELDLCAAEV